MSPESRRLVAGVQFAGTLLGILYFRGSVLTGPNWVRTATGAVFVAFIGALAIGGTLLLRAHPWGVPMSAALQAIQIPAWATHSFTYMLHGPFALGLGVASNWDISFEADLSTHLYIAVGKTPEVASFSLNLFAVALLYLLLRSKTPKKLPTVGGVVVR